MKRIVCGLFAAALVAAALGCNSGSGPQTPDTSTPPPGASGMQIKTGSSKPPPPPPIPGR